MNIEPGKRAVVAVEGQQAPTGVWSTAIIARPGAMVFVSGLIARDEQGAVVGPGDIAVQTEFVLTNLRAALRAAGADLSDLVRIDVHVTDISKFAEIHAVRRRFFPVDPPASTMVEISRLIDDGCLIEISGIAVIA